MVLLKRKFHQIFLIHPGLGTPKRSSEYIQYFIQQPLVQKNIYEGKMLINQRPSIACNRILTDENKTYRLTSRLDLESEKFLGKSFKWKNDHPIIDS